MRFLKNTLNPAWYHGHRASPPFFEGWYFKLISADEAHRFAIIPGVFLGKNGYAFIQVLNGSTGFSEFIKYPLSEFWAAEEDLHVRIGGSEFRADAIYLDVQAPGGKIVGDLKFGPLRPWPVTVASPGVMGWYAWVPRMECSHGVLGFDHGIEGALEVKGETHDFSGGRGYMEKDWGQAFPQGYVWMQSNHFGTEGVSLSASAAMIPWIGYAFRGYIVGLYLQGELYRFATYTGAKLTAFSISDHQVEMTLEDRKHVLEITAHRSDTGLLKGPTRAEMDMRVAESLTAWIDVRLQTTGGEVIFEGTGQHAGLEVAGDIPRLLEG
ncbi:MAG: tocopherol cyclase family protein [Anaerolineales bacterium]